MAAKEKLGKIILIENQFTQFKKIWNFLDEEYEVFPNIKKETLQSEAEKEKYKRNQFKDFIDLFRVCLNERYSKNYRDDAFQKIKQIIIDEVKPDLLIIDHILVGNHEAKNGLDLAIKLRGEKISQPIMFLSRTEANSSDVIKQYPHISEKKIWINKGFAGDRILHPKYFKEDVLPQINKLISESIFNRDILQPIILIKSKVTTTKKELKNQLYIALDLINKKENLNNKPLLNILSKFSENNYYTDKTVKNFISEVNSILKK